MGLRLIGAIVVALILAAGITWLAQNITITKRKD